MDDFNLGYIEYMQRQSISLVSFCLLFGILLGIAGLLSFEYIGSPSRTVSAQSKAEQSYITATERLENYACRSDETKKIVMGGLEDNFNPDGDKEVTRIPSFIIKEKMEVFLSLIHI